MNLKLGRRIDDLLAIKGHSRPTSSAISGQHSEAKALSIQRCAAKYMQYYLFDFFGRCIHCCPYKPFLIFVKLF